MHQSRSLSLALILLLVAFPVFWTELRQTASPAPAVPTIAIPPYPDTARGLEKLLSEMMKLEERGR